jgi:hypothetical protein
MGAELTTARCEEDEARSILERPNKGMKLTRPGQLRSLAAYSRCWADWSDMAGTVMGKRKTGVVGQISAQLGGLLALLSLVAGGCTSSEDRQFYATFDAISVGTPEAEVVRRLGPPKRAGTKFYLSQPAGYEKQYREAAESAAVRYLFWHREIDVTCAVGLDAADRVAYKACGAT